MVGINKLLNVFEDVHITSSVTLPKYKEIGFKIEFKELQHIDVTETDVSNKVPPWPFANSEVFHVNILSWKRVTAVNSGCKPTYEVSFDVTNENLNFFPGDTIGIIPRNNASEVDAIIKHLGFEKQADLVYNLSLHQTGSKVPGHIPVRSTLRHVLSQCVDIRCIVKKLFLLALSRYTTDKDERRMLEFLCSKEGSAAYNTHILSNNICVLDIFNIFKTCKPSLEVILAHLPRLLPRPYSIMNSSQRYPNIIKICFSVMDIGNHRKGLTTSWLESIIEKMNIVDKFRNLNINNEHDEGVTEKVSIYLRKNVSGFDISQYPTSNLILIGPGTGVSQFIGLLEERHACIKQSTSEDNTEAWLFFGCRDPNLDFIYEREIKGFVNNKSLSKLCTAFSRVDNNNIKYVQDAILENSSDVARLIERGAVIIVCGDMKRMGEQVRDSIVQCLTNAKRTREDAEILVSHLQSVKRYHVDIWS